MPSKKCPQCDKEHGSRKKVCDCGHDFGAPSSSHPLVPEPGGWVVDNMKGMPEIQPSPPLDGSMLSVTEVSQCVSYEGLGYCIYAYIAPKKISDVGLRKLWVEAQTALRKVYTYLEDHA